MTVISNIRIIASYKFQAMLLIMLQMEDSGRQHNVFAIILRCTLKTKSAR